MFICVIYHRSAAGVRAKSIRLEISRLKKVAKECGEEMDMETYGEHTVLDKLVGEVIKKHHHILGSQMRIKQNTIRALEDRMGSRNAENMQLRKGLKQFSFRCGVCARRPEICRTFG